MDADGGEEREGLARREPACCRHRLNGWNKRCKWISETRPANQTRVASSGTVSRLGHRRAGAAASGHDPRHRGKVGVMRTQSPDTSPEAERVLIELLRQAPAWRRLQLADRMSSTVRSLSLAGLRARHPRASEAELRRRFADIHLGPKLAAKVYGPRPAD